MADAGGLALSTGLLSGIDSAQLVDALTARQREPIKLSERKQHILTLQKEEFQSVNSAIFAVEDSLLQLSLNSTFNSKLAKSTDETVSTAIATTDAEVKSYDLEITTLAEAHQIASNKQTSVSDSLSSSDATIQVNGVSLILSAGTTLKTLSTAINGVKDQTKVSSEIIDNTLVLTSTESGASNTITVEDSTGSVMQNLGVIKGSGSNIETADNLGEIYKSVTLANYTATAGTITVGGTNVSLVGGEDLNGVATAINNASIGGITAFVESNQLHIAAQGGTVGLIDFVGSNASVLNTGGATETSSGFTEQVTNGTLAQGNPNVANWANDYGGVFSSLNYLITDQANNGFGTGIFKKDDTVDIAGEKYKLRDDINPVASAGTLFIVKNTDGTDIAGSLEATLDAPHNYSITRSYLDVNGKTLTINGQNVNFATDVNIQEAVDVINAAGITDVFAEKTINNELRLVSSQPLTITGDAKSAFGTFNGDTGTGSFSNDSFYNTVASSFTINGSLVNIEAFSTLTEIRDAINAQTDTTNVTATLSGGQLSFSHSGNADINFADLTGSIVGDLEFAGGGIQNELQAGVNSSFKINGLTVTRSDNEVTDVVDNVTFNLLKTGSSTINVDYDKDNTQTKVEDFVEKYNSAIELVYNKLNAKKDFQLDGLTKEELQTLSAEEIEEKEEALRKQSLSGDPLLRRAYNTLRSMSFTTLETTGKFKSLNDIGLSTGKVGSNADQTKIGKLVVHDSTKFSEALSKNMDDIRLLFAQEKSSDDDPVSKLGIAERFKEEFERYTNYNGLLTKKAGRADSKIFSLLDLEINALESDILFKNRSLLNYQNALLTQFTNMETALAELQDQSNALSQASGGF